MIPRALQRLGRADHFYSLIVLLVATIIVAEWGFLVMSALWESKSLRAPSSNSYTADPKWYP